MGTGEAVEAGGGGTQRQYHPQTAERLSCGRWGSACNRVRQTVLSKGFVKYRG